MTTLSLTIVNYQSQLLVARLLKSIQKYPPPVSFEIIIVDNSDADLLQTEAALSEINLPIKIIRSPGNIGFGQAQNIAVKAATGKYIAVLNPDLVVEDKNIWSLYKKITNKVAIVAPKVVDFNHVWEQNAGQIITPFNYLVTQTWISRFFSRSQTQKLLNSHKPEAVGYVSGAVFFVKRTDFLAMHGFDRQFFLYFEDNDLCLRFIKKNKQILYVPGVTAKHQGGGSQKRGKKTLRIFQKSRYLYFKKHFGLIQAAPIEIIIRLLEAKKLLF